MHSLKADLRRAFGSWLFVAAAAGIPICALLATGERTFPLLMGRSQAEMQESFAYSLCLEGLSAQITLCALPVFASLPFSASFIEEENSRFLRFFLPRSGFAPFVRSRCVATALSGGCACGAGAGAAALLFVLLFPPSADSSSMTGIEAREEAALAARLLTELLGRLFLFLLSGALWALVGGAFAVIADSRFLAYVAPFIFCYMLVILTQRYFPSLYVLDPQQWLNPGPMWPAGTWGAAAVAALLTAAAALTYGLVMERRLAE